MEELDFMNYSIGNNSEKYTIEEVSKMENHAELIDGELIIIENTTVTHNRVVNKIANALEQFINSNNGGCEVFRENVALYCNELCDSINNFFYPDIMSICDESGIEENGIHVAPRFVAEITSISTRRHDYFEKKHIYEKIGVQEYWIVDLQGKLVMRHLQDNNYFPGTFLPPLTSIPVHSYPGLQIDLSEFF